MIEIIVGTNRRGSLSEALGNCLIDIYRKSPVEAQLMSLQDLPPETFSPDAYQEKPAKVIEFTERVLCACLLYTSPSPRDVEESRMPSSA